jgi:hypothetical protein
MVLVAGAGPPLEADLEETFPAEVTLLEQTLDSVAVGQPGKPGRPGKRSERLMANWDDDRNPRRARLAPRCIESIIPARHTYTSATHQDGCQLHRYYAGGLRNGPVSGRGTLATSWCTISAWSPLMPVSFIWPVTSSPNGGL